MDIDVFHPEQLPTVMRVLRSALSPSAALDARQQLFLATYARITGFPEPIDLVLPITHTEVVIDGEHQRKRLIQLAAVAALLNRPIDPDSVICLRTLAEHLQVRDGVVDVLDALARGRLLEVRLLAMRRALRALLADAWRSEGTAGALRFLAAMFFERGADPGRARDYQRLGLLPADTLGRAYWEHMTECGFGFPGDPRGIPATVAYHDVAHVLAAHDTSPLGEIQQGSFQAGNRREDGFFFLQFVLLQFHHGIKLTPRSPAYVGCFHPDKVLWAIHRGARCKVDVTHQWNFWPLMELPLEQARACCGLIPPLGADSSGQSITNPSRVGKFACP